MGRRYTYRDGDVEIELDGALEGMADQILQGAPGIVSRAMEAEADAIKAEALATWPVRSGKSRDAFRVTTRLDPDGVVVVLENTAPYAYKIKFSKYTSAELKSAGTTAAQRDYLKKKYGEGAPTDALTMRSVWGERVRKPARRSEKKLAEELEPELVALANGEGVS